jgi:hypothetical protein
MLAVIVSALPASPISAQEAPAYPREQLESLSASSPSGRYQGNAIESEEMSDQALADVGKERTAIEQRFSAEERACYDKFFANACVDEAKERRRLALEQARKLEVEANAFKRRARVIERDKDLADKREKEEQKRAQHIEREQRNPSESSGKSRAAAQEPRLPDIEHKDAGVNPRVAQHEAKLKRLQAEERANAQKRAENVAAYEKKVKDAEERQRKVEARKKENDRARANKESSAPGR